MNTELTTLATTETAAKIFAAGGSDDIVYRIESEARALVADVETASGRKAIASNAAKVARSKTYLDGLGKDLVAGLKEQTKAVDAERRAMREKLDALKVKVRKPLTDYERAEESRKQALQDRVTAIAQELPVGSVAIAARRAEVEAIAIDDTLVEIAPLAAMAKDAELARLRGAYDSAIAAEKAETERKSAEERSRADREERIAKAAAEKATLDAERRAQESIDAERDKQARKDREQEAQRLTKERELIEAERAALQAKRRQQEAEENAKRQAEDAANRARQQAEADMRRQQAEEERIEAARLSDERRKSEDRHHRQAVNRAALDALQNDCGLSFDDAKSVVSSIASGSIPCVSIHY